MTNNFGIIIHDEVIFAPKEVHDALVHCTLIEDLWVLTEKCTVTQTDIIWHVRKLGYGNSRDEIQYHWFDNPEDYWTACEYLLLLVLAAEGEELPS